MSDEVATLADTVVTPSADDTTATQASTDAKPEPAAATQPSTADVSTVDKDAETIGRILLDSGYTKEQLNDLMNAPQMLQSIRYQIENDPKEFIRAIERANPKAGERLMESLTDMYVERYGDKGKAAAAKGGKEEATAEVEALRDRLSRLEGERAQEKQQAALASVRQRYQGRVDDLFGLKEVKELGLTKAEAKAMRASLDVELGKDQGVQQRILNGNFVDVPKAFRGIVEEWVADRKASVEAAKTARETSQKDSFFEFASGPNPLASLPTDTFDSWDKTEEAFARILERAK